MKEDRFMSILMAILLGEGVAQLLFDIWEAATGTEVSWFGWVAIGVGIVMGRWFYQCFRVVNVEQSALSNSSATK